MVCASTSRALAIRAKLWVETACSRNTLLTKSLGGFSIPSSSAILFANSACVSNPSLIIAASNLARDALMPRLRFLTSMPKVFNNYMIELYINKSIIARSSASY